MALFRVKNTLLREQHGQMARAKRHFLPGHVWHITHRCHKKEFLLKFARDRRRWLQWLFEAKDLGTSIGKILGVMLFDAGAGKVDMRVLCLY